ncbi:hypothetical protein HCU40_14875 [Pseudanabaena biceps]|nr:hypothetical protein [Pseudanabaena biceps]
MYLKCQSRIILWHLQRSLVLLGHKTRRCLTVCRNSFLDLFPNASGDSHVITVTDDRLSS